MKKSMNLLTMSLGLGLMLAGPIASAQQAEQYSNPTTPATQQPATMGQATVSEDKLKNFVDAHQEINEIRMDYSGKIQAVQDPQKAQELQVEAQTKMVEAVENNDLKIEEYNQIAQQVQQDPAMRQRLESMIGS